MTHTNNPTKEEELRRKVEDLIVDTSLHPVDASLRIMQLFTQELEKREDVAGLKERRQEVYQIWSRVTVKGFNISLHPGYVDMFYRRFNDLTDQLIELTDNTRYAHYEKDTRTGAPVEVQLKDTPHETS